MLAVPTVPNVPQGILRRPLQALAGVACWLPESTLSICLVATEVVAALAEPQIASISTP